MFKVKFETKNYKYFLKMDGREVCLSSDTPEDDDIKDIVFSALESYHEYVVDQTHKFLKYYNIPGGINNNTKDFDMICIEKALVELVYNDLKDHSAFSPTITSEYVTKIKENISDKAIVLTFFEEYIDRLCLLNDRINNSITYFVIQNKIVIPESHRDEVYKRIRLQVLEKCKSVPNHTPQPYTQKLLDRGVLKFSETFNNEKHYNITPSYIMNYCSDSTDIRDTTVNVFVEVYDVDNNFKIFTCIFCEDTDDVNVTPDDLLIYQVMEV